MTKTAQKAGYDFETLFFNTVKELGKREPISALRLYDSKSAGGYLPAQPGDFLVTYAGITNVVELKSSSRFTTLAGKRTPLTSLFSEAQLANMRWMVRAQAASHVLFLSTETSEVEWWDGMDVVRAFLEPKGKLDINQLCSRFPLSDLPKKLTAGTQGGFLTSPEYQNAWRLPR